MCILKLENVSMSFDTGKGRRMQACRSVNLGISRKEIITVVGESGCGKSTLGKICLGIQKPTSGKVLLKGRDIWAPGFKWDKENRLSVQVIHQDSYASLNPVKTVGQILSAPLVYHRMASRGADAVEKVQSLLKKVGLTPSDYFQNKYPFQLSGGQRQRVSIARAAIFNPDLIIADEPVSGVDSSLRLSILELMKEMNRRQNIGFFYITHDLATARFFGAGGRVIVMYLGRIVEQGEISMVMEDPRHPYLQALMSASSPEGFNESSTDNKITLKSHELPDPSDLPPGCPFSPRCPHSMEICTTQEPQLKPLKKNPCHIVACFLNQESPLPQSMAD